MQTSVKNIDNKHNEWKQNLGFYKDELNIFKKRLHEIAEKNTGKEVMQMVEHFQNQFLIQAENIDIMLHDIVQHINLIARQTQQHAGHVENEQVTLHVTLQKRVEEEAVIFKNIKVEYLKFLSKVM